jgi:hypothetical protein
MNTRTSADVVAVANMQHAKAEAAEAFTQMLINRRIQLSSHTPRIQIFTTPAQSLTPTAPGPTPTTQLPISQG